MPGLFTPPPSGRSSSRLDIFAPAPRFPITGETTGSAATAAARKRFRYGDSETSQSFSHTSIADDGWEDRSLGLSRRFSDARSPPPLANDRYQLAGGMDRSDMFTRQAGDYDDYFHLEKTRGGWYSPATPAPGPQYVADTLIQPTPTGARPWMLNQIFSLVGGVAGRLVQFCAVPFRGFQAGGGQAYTYGAKGEVKRAEAHDDLFNQKTFAPVQQPLPGDFPEDNFGVASLESLEDERPRMTKRMRTGDSWVVVGDNGETDSRPGTPRLSERRTPAAMSHCRSPSQIPRPVSRAGTSPNTPKRPSLIPVSRRSTLARKSFGATEKPTDTLQNRPRSYSRQSYGSPVMFENKKNPASPLPPESQRLLNKFRREELEDDARMRRMTSQIDDMFRQAQEALSSKAIIQDISMDYDDDDDERFSEEAPWQRR